VHVLAMLMQVVYGNLPRELPNVNNTSRPRKGRSWVRTGTMQSEIDEGLEYVSQAKAELASTKEKGEQGQEEKEKEQEKEQEPPTSDEAASDVRRGSGSRLG